jgi:hypothetical protein
MPESIVELLNNGSQACFADKFRHGNLIKLPAEGSLITTGDIHGHRRNFERIITFADLSNNPDRHVVLQEIIHGGPQDPEGGCLSYKLLFEAVRYKLNYPDRVHIIIGNHDTAVINDSKVIKDGKEMNEPMNLALEREYRQASADIKLAMKQFLISQPLAVRCDNRIWLSHSLPGNQYVNKFDKDVLKKQLEIKDFAKPGSAYLLTWGRNHTQHTLDTMAKILDVDTFILGHQPQQQGWRQAGNNLIIIASNHNHGCLLPINLTQSYTVQQLIDSIVPLTSIA